VSHVAAVGVARPTIGDILLSHGFVDADTLVGAAEEQTRTGQPLGQILVERGAITRLELASALAEQWAEAPAPGQPPAESGNGLSIAAPASSPPAGSAVIDDDTYALRVQAAVSDLARRVGAAEPLLAEVERRASESVSPEALEASLVEVRRNVDASLERVNGLESALEGASTRLDQVTDGLEEAFGEMQAGAAELAERLATTAAAAMAAATKVDLETLRQALDVRLAELAASIEAESRQLAEARATLAALAERPVLGPEIEVRLEKLAAHLDGVAHVDDLAELRAALEGLEDRLAVAADATALAALRRDVDRLAARTDVSPELESRLDELDTRLSGTAGADALARLQEAFAELGERIDTAADAVSLEEVRARLEAIAEPHTGGIARLEGVEAFVTDLAARVESLGAVAASGTSADAIEELRGALEELGRRRHGDEETVARLEVLAATVEELAAHRSVDPALADRVEGLAQALEGVAADTAVAELRTAVEAFADRSGAGESALAELAARIEELSSGMAASQTDELAAGLRTDVDEIRLRLEADDALLAELRAAASELAARPAGDPDLAPRLTSLAARVDELATASAQDGLAVELDAVAARIAAIENTIEPQPDGTVGPADLVAFREELTEDLREGLARLTAEAPAGDLAWVEEAARLGERLDALSALVRDGMPAAAADAKTPARRAPTSTDAGSDTERELERLRMAIERMSMHLGEQERALAEVMRSRGVAQRLDEIEARLDDVAAGAAVDGAVAAAPGGAAPAGNSADARALARRLDGAEAALEAEREKLLTKLDRMASSIDWRLQRLEAGSPEGT
jgi:hypothetical protein